MNLKPDFTIIENYRDNTIYRNEFYSFISKVFPSISFQDWHDKGFWTDNYIPFSLLKNGNIVSNVCAAVMKVLINSLEYNAIQIGAVGTLPDYRYKGLSKYLMDYVIKKLEPNTDFFFLYANESVLDFYPKFGFKKYDEFVFIKDYSPSLVNPQVRKLNLDDQNDYSILQKILSGRIPVTKRFGALDYQFVTMWHILNLYPNDLYYSEKENSVIIFRQKNNILSIIDVICTEEINIDLLIPKLVHSHNISKIKFYFPPDQLYYKYDNIEKESTDLFIRGSVKLPEDPYRFPANAIT